VPERAPPTRTSAPELEDAGPDHRQIERQPERVGEHLHNLEEDRVDPRLSVREWQYISGVPYARKIEKAHTDGVYEGVAALARARFGNIIHLPRAAMGG